MLSSTKAMIRNTAAYEFEKSYFCKKILDIGLSSEYASE